MARICLEPLWHPSNLGEHLHFEDRDEVGWLGPSSLTPHDEEKRKRRSGRSEWNGAATNLAHPSFPPSLPPSISYPFSAGILDCFPRLFIAAPSYNSARRRTRSSPFGDAYFVGEEGLVDAFDGRAEHFLFEIKTTYHCGKS